MEGVVIVGSILLAFGIQAWWDGVLDRREEREILLGLREEFIGHQDDLRGRAARNQLTLTGISRLLVPEGSDGAELEGAAVDSSLVQLLYASTWDPGRQTLDAVISSGRLELLRSADLRSRLASWGGSVDEVRDGELLLRTFVTQTIVPFLASEGVPLDRAYGTIGSWPESVPFLDPPPMGYGRLFRNPEFISLAQFKLSWEHVSVREYEEALSRATQIISLINRELGDK